MGAVVRTDYSYQTAPHGKRERRFQQPGQIFMECGLVDHRASVLAAQIRRPRRQRDDLVPRRKANSVGQDIGALVVEHDLLDFFGGPVEPPRPSRGRLDKLERHILVVADIPSVDPGAPAGSSTKRAIRRFSPGDPDAPRFLADFDLRLIGKPSPLVRKKY